MFNVKSLVRQPAGLASVSLLTALAGLAMRTCHSASEGLNITLCSGKTLAMAAPSTSLMHCSGCYIAVAGGVGLLISGLWMARERL